MKRLDRLEVARGLAALAIVFYHANAIVQTPKYFGRAPFGALATIAGIGVDFFFVLSGFILFFVHRRDLGQPGQFYRYTAKRLVRIYPPYWAVTLLLIPAYLLFPSFGGGNVLEPRHIADSLLLLPAAKAPIVAVAWSLQVEVMFYALFGLLVWRPKVGIAVIVIWQLAVVAATRSSPVENPALLQLLDFRNVQFVLGIAAASLVGKTGFRRAGWITASGFALVLFMGLAEFKSALLLPRTAHLLCIGLGSMVTIVGVASQDLQSGERPHRLLRILGEASYSIYLIHYALLSLLAKIFVSAGISHWLPAEGWFLLISGLATAGGIAFHSIVEKPLLSFCQRRFVPKMREPPAKASWLHVRKGD